MNSKLFLKSLSSLIPSLISLLATTFWDLYVSLPLSITSTFKDDERDLAYSIRFKWSYFNAEIKWDILL
jgi:hypothetical protein